MGRRPGPDAADRLTAEVDVGTNGGTPWVRPAAAPARSDTTLVTSYAYGPAGLPVGVVGPDGVSHTTALDALGRAVGETAAAGTAAAATTAYAYDAGGRLAAVTDPLGRVTRFAYDRAGRVTRATDPRGTPTDYAYDPPGRTTAVVEAAGFAEQRTTAYAYNAAGEQVAAAGTRGLELRWPGPDGVVGRAGRGPLPGANGRAGSEC